MMKNGWEGRRKWDYGFGVVPNDSVFRVCEGNYGELMMVSVGGWSLFLANSLGTQR